MQSLFVEHDVRLCNQVRRYAPVILESRQGSRINGNFFRNQISHGYLGRIGSLENACSQLAGLLAHFVEVHAGIEKAAPLYAWRGDREDRNAAFACRGHYRFESDQNGDVAAHPKRLCSPGDERGCRFEDCRRTVDVGLHQLDSHFLAHLATHPCERGRIRFRRVPG